MKRPYAHQRDPRVELHRMNILPSLHCALIEA